MGIQSMPILPGTYLLVTTGTTRTAGTTVAATAAALAIATRGTTNGHGLVIVHDVVADQIDAALTVDLGNAALESVADVDDIFNLLNALVVQPRRL